MRILTRTQYDAICDIVTEKDKKIAELEEEVQKKQETIDYINEKLFTRNREYINMKNAFDIAKKLLTVDQRHLVYLKAGLIDFPATTKQPEDNFN